MLLAEAMTMPEGRTLLAPVTMATSLIPQLDVLTQQPRRHACKVVTVCVLIRVMASVQQPCELCPA